MSGGHDAHGHDAHGHEAPGAVPHEPFATFGIVAAGFLACGALALQLCVGAMAPEGAGEGHGGGHGAAPEPTDLETPDDGLAPSLMLVNAKVVTPGRARAGAVILIRDGKIQAIGGPELEKRKAAGTVVTDLHGAAVLPGLRDAHGHLASLGRLLNQRECDLSDCSSLVDVKQRLVAWMQNARHPKPGEWIVGRGWDESKWETLGPAARDELEKAALAHAEGKKDGPRFEDRPNQGWVRVASKQPDSTELLDEVAPENPIVLYRIDGHAAWCNQAALDLAKISHDSFVIQGGEIVRDKKGEPTGLLLDAAMELVTKLLPADPAEWILEDTRRGAEECARVGLVEVHDAGVGEQGEKALRTLAAEGKLPIRVYAMLSRPSNAALAERLSQSPTVEPIGGRLTFRAVKLYADGALGSRGAHLLAPYADKPSSLGLPTMPREDLEAAATLCAERGYQLCVHAIGDAANRTVLSVYERALAGRKDARFRVEHAQVVEPTADRALFGKLGVIASMQPTHATTDMRWAEDRLGKVRLAGAYAWRSLVSSGAHVAFGSDFPVESPAPLLGLYAAVTRQDEEGKPEGGWLAGERLTPAEALRAFTEEVAFASFAEGKRGRLAPGQDADLTVLSDDPIALLSGKEPKRALEVKVLGTYVAGVPTDGKGR